MSRHNRYSNRIEQRPLSISGNWLSAT